MDGTNRQWRGAFAPRHLVCILFIAVAVALAGLWLRRPAERPLDVSSAADVNALRVTVIDVGQGDAILVQFPDQRCMLVDAGDEEHGPVVRDYIRRQGISRIALLVATHPHADHIGGMRQVLGAFSVEKVWNSGYVHGTRLQEQFLRTIKEKGIRYGMPRAGVTQDFGAVRVKVLAPCQNIAGTESDANNNSLVLLVTYGSYSVLLTGDMEEEERRSVRHWPRATVLKVAHHGSRNGTESAFLAQVQPRLAIISCGRGNDFGHPHRETISALTGAGSDVRQTAQEGTITFSTDGSTYVRVNTADSSNQASQASPSAPPAVPSATYIGNSRSRVLHVPTCISLPGERNRAYFASREEAVARGYHPCGRCQP